jgi:hypothetical protein
MQPVSIVMVQMQHPSKERSMKAARILSAWMAAIGLLASGGAWADPHFVRGRIGWDVTIGLPFPWNYGPSYHYPYYPYVKECPSGWERVSPVPPAPSAQK